EPAVRAPFESALGSRFDDVRVHTGARASESARDIGALAYTAENHIVFRDPWRFDAASSAGRRLLGHELTHVVQQRGAPFLLPRLSLPGDASEKEADRVAAHFDQSPWTAGRAPMAPVEARGGHAAVQKQDDGFSDPYRTARGKVLSHLKIEYKD